MAGIREVHGAFGARIPDGPSLKVEVGGPRYSCDIGEGLIGGKASGR